MNMGSAAGLGDSDSPGHYGCELADPDSNVDETARCRL